MNESNYIGQFLEPPEEESDMVWMDGQMKKYYDEFESEPMPITVWTDGDLKTTQEQQPDIIQSGDYNTKTIYGHGSTCCPKKSQPMILLGGANHPSIMVFGELGEDFQAITQNLLKDFYDYMLSVMQGYNSPRPRARPYMLMGNLSVFGKELMMGGNLSVFGNDYTLGEYLYEGKTYKFYEIINDNTGASVIHMTTIQYVPPESSPVWLAAETYTKETSKTKKIETLIKQIEFWKTRYPGMIPMDLYTLYNLELEGKTTYYTHYWSWLRKNYGEHISIYEIDNDGYIVKAMPKPKPYVTPEERKKCDITQFTWVPYTPPKPPSFEGLATAITNFTNSAPAFFANTANVIKTGLQIRSSDQIKYNSALEWINWRMAEQFKLISTYDMLPGHTKRMADLATGINTMRAGIDGDAKMIELYISKFLAGPKFSSVELTDDDSWKLGDMKLPKFVALVAKFTIILNNFTSLEKILGNWSNNLKSAFTYSAAMGKKASLYMEGLLDYVGKTLIGGTMADLKAYLDKVNAKLGDIFSSTHRAFQDFVVGITNSVQDFIGNIANAISKDISLIQAWLRKGLETISTEIQKAIAQIPSYLITLVDGLQKNIVTNVTNFTNVFQCDVTERIKDGLRQLNDWVQDVRGWLIDDMRKLSRWFETSTKEIWERLEGVYNELKGKLQGAYDQAVKEFDRKLQEFREYVTRVNERMETMITNASDEIYKHRKAIEEYGENFLEVFDRLKNVESKLKFVPGFETPTTPTPEKPWYQFWGEKNNINLTGDDFV